MSRDAHIQSFFLHGPAGRLEALLNLGAPEAPLTAVVAHPHPLFGGTMHNKVVFHAMRALNDLGLPVLRFNFRGAGSSAGKHDEGRGEVDDVRTAIEWLRHEFARPILFAGFSFGAAAGMHAACPSAEVAAIASLGTPMSAEGWLYEYSLLAACAKPKLFLSGDHDEFAPSAELAAVVRRAAEPKRFVLIPGADHFFTGHLDEMRAALDAWVRDVLLVPAADV